MRQAMTDLAFSPEEQLSVSKILGAVMNLSLLDFIPGQTEDSSQVKNKDRCELVARILDLHEAPISVEQSLCQEEMVVKRGSRSSVSWKQSTPKKAALARDAFAKALYGLLFDWLVVKVNKSLFKGETAVHFGVLDIFGFETFQEVNVWSQLWRPLDLGGSIRLAFLYVFGATAKNRKNKHLYTTIPLKSEKPHT